MYKRIIQGLALVVLPCLFCGCQLMPAEESLPEVPPIYSAEVNPYKHVAVARGDLIKTDTVYCGYVPTESETLSFSLNGVPIEKVYVVEGQRVHAGDLLATLELGSLEDEIAAQEYQLQVLVLKKTHLLENKALEMKLCEAQYGEPEKAAKKTEIEAKYEKQLQEMSDSIYIQELRLNQQKEKLKDRQIRAGIDGMVTYVRKTAEGQKSVKDQGMVSIMDFDTALFRVLGEDTAYFKMGDKVTIRCRQVDREATVVDGAELGMDTVVNGKPALYLKPAQPDSTLDSSARGSTQITLDQRSDVLYVHKDAIKTADGKPFVYRLNEDGLRTVQMISTGLEAGNHVEITDGLKEGDQVILD